MHNFNCMFIVIINNIGETPRDYYFGFFRNYRGDGTISVILATTGSQSVQYSIQAPGIGYSDSGTVTANSRSIVTIPDTIQVFSYADENKGVYLTTSSDQVTVMGQNVQSHTSDTFLILPLTKKFAKQYVYFGMSVTRTTVHSESLHSATLIVGTKDDTVLNLTVTQYVTISVGGITSYLTAGETYSFVINRLQTVYLGPVEDITGTKIVTSHPVSVISGHECANVPYNVGWCDYVIEQIPPTIFWDKVYYVAPLTTRSRSTIKVLAASDSTDVDIYCENIKTSYTINQGRFVDHIIGHENCAIYASDVVLVSQLGHGSGDDGTTGDPMMMLVPATTQYYDEFTFTTIYDASWPHYVNIIVFAEYYQPDKIYMIGEGINQTLYTQYWTPVIVNNVNEAYITQVSIQEGVHKVLHTNTEALMTTMVYGFASYEGYGHPGGFRGATGIVLF